MKEALLIIDVQNDYFPGGANELSHPFEAENRIRELIDERPPEDPFDLIPRLMEQKYSL